MSFDGREKRRFVRLEVDLPVKFKIPKVSIEWSNAVGKNISLGGILIEANDIDKTAIEIIKKKDTLIDTEITIGDQSLHAEGKVINVLRVPFMGIVKWASNETKAENLKFGVQFHSISEESQEIIRKYLLKLYIDKYNNIR
jgi:c-di-GMP-binding flagellar brake protein YcgR